MAFHLENRTTFLVSLTDQSHINVCDKSFKRTSIVTTHPVASPLTVSLSDDFDALFSIPLRYQSSITQPHLPRSPFQSIDLIPILTFIIVKFCCLLKMVLHSLIDRSGFHVLNVQPN
ncbi:hypothetical protein P9112_010502 [Eukaryota sp. TZLM1-RC]